MPPIFRFPQPVNAAYLAARRSKKTSACHCRNAPCQSGPWDVVINRGGDAFDDAKLVADSTNPPPGSDRPVDLLERSESDETCSPIPRPRIDRSLQRRPCFGNDGKGPSTPVPGQCMIVSMDVLALLPRHRISPTYQRAALRPLPIGPGTGAMMLCSVQAGIAQDFCCEFPGIVVCRNG